MHALDISTSKTNEKKRTLPGVSRGFATMDPLKQREIASLGGKTAHQKGTAHTWNSDTAREAGRKAAAARARNRAAKRAIQQQQTQA
jgi:hypothetical protein